MLLPLLILLILPLLLLVPIFLFLLLGDVGDPNDNLDPGPLGDFGDLFFLLFFVDELVFAILLFILGSQIITSLCFKPLLPEVKLPIFPGNNFFNILTISKSSSISSESLATIVPFGNFPDFSNVLPINNVFNKFMFSSLLFPVSTFLLK